MQGLFEILGGKCQTPCFRGNVVRTSFPEATSNVEKSSQLGKLGKSRVSKLTQIRGLFRVAQFWQYVL
jgi:hypothetical protein